MNGHCSFCGEKIEIIDKVSRTDVCPSCGRDLHTCIQCKFYDEGSYNQCREPQAERVIDKEKANFCEYFKWADRKPAKDTKKESFSKLDALFKK